MANCRLQFIWIALSFAGLTRYVEGSYSVEVRSGQRFCVAVRTPKNQLSTYSGDFEAMDNRYSYGPLKYVIYRNKNYDEPIYETSGSGSGRFEFKGQGRHEICVENGYGNSRQADRITRRVGFAIRIRKNYHAFEDSTGPLTETLDTIEVLTDDMLINLEELLDHIELWKDRERGHRELIENTFSNVWKWTLFEKIVLVLVSVGQVFYFKSFFSMKQKMFSKGSYY